MNPREQGDRGELSAVDWLIEQGSRVFLPFGHSPDIDLIAVTPAGDVQRVQVKTTVRRTPAGNWQPMLCTKGGNQSWGGVTKFWDAGRCDYLFVLVGDGRRWFIPSGRVEARTAIVLGGSKYSEFEVARGRPILNPAA